jgi:heme oxygenase
MGGDEYGAFLAQMVCVHSSLESALRITAARIPEVRAMHRPHHERLTLLCDDLDALGIPAAELAPLPAASALSDLILRAAAEDHWALVGIWYVLEGSTNGGAVIAKNVRDARGFTDSRGTAFVNPHGPRVRIAWTEFKTGLDALQLDDAARERIVAAASQTFRLFGDLLEQLASRPASHAGSRSASPA